MPHRGDAGDDPAIWIHPTDPEQSLILGTDKDGGLHVYNMDGSNHQLVSDGNAPNNVDVLYGFKSGNELVDIALAGMRAKSSRGGKVWVIDPTTRALSDVTEGGVFKVFGGREPYSTTDGIAVTNRPTSKHFPKGVFIAHDGRNSGGNQNFKLYAWEDIAGTRLIVDTSWSPREK